MKKLFVVITLVLAAISLHAEDESVESKAAPETGKSTEDQIVVSARGYDKPVSATPGGVGIVTSDDIQKHNPVSVSDSLKDITGVNKSADGAWGSEISIRGATREKVVLLIDGCRVNTATDIGAQFGTLNPISVEKIEVLKGPISSLYGSGTIGGVVNVITRNGKFTDTPGFESGISVSGESNAPGLNTYGFTSYNSSSWYVFGSGGYRKHGSYKSGNGSEVDNSGFNDAQGTVNMGVKPAPDHSIEIRTQYYRGWDIGVPGARDTLKGVEKATSPETERALVSTDYTFEPGNNIWQKSLLHMYWQYLGRSMKNENPDTTPPPVKPLIIEPEASHNTLGLQWSNTLSAGDHSVVTGIETWFRTYRGEREKTLNNGSVIRDNPLPDCSFLSTGLFAEDDWALGDFTINIGARGDYILVSCDKTYKQTAPLVTANYWSGDSVNDYSWNAHAGVTYMIVKQVTTTALAASGYRAAALEERYKYILQGTIEKFGNPDLDPERSFFFEYGLHLITNRVTSNASVYVNILRDLIAEKQTSATRYDLVNVNRALLWGAEYDIDIKITDPLSVHGDLSWIRGRDTKNDEDLPSIAPLRLTGGIRYNSAFGLSAFFDTVYTAEQNRVPSGTKKSPDWVRLDTGISWTVKAFQAEHRFFFTCTNLLNSAYHDYLVTASATGKPFDEPGRNFKGGYSVVF